MLMEEKGFVIAKGLAGRLDDVVPTSAAEEEQD